MQRTYSERDVRPLDIRDEVAAYKQPNISKGSIVFWYKNGQKRGDGLIGFVQAVNQSTIDLYVPGHPYARMSGIRHVTDPWLKIPANRADSGGWDFSDAHCILNAWMDNMRDRVAALEKTIEQLVKDKADRESRVAKAQAAK